MARLVKVSDFENKAAAARGRPVARLVPVPRRRNTPEQERAIIDANIDLINAEARACIADQGTREPMVTPG